MSLTISFVHSFNTHLLRFYYVLAIVIIMGIVINIRDNNPALTELSKEMTNK